MSKPSSTAALKQLSRQRFSLDKLPDVLAEINASSDRSVAIVLGSLVEDALRAVIMRQMPHLTKQEENELFEGFGPLSDFSAKIAICYGMKIFGVGSHLHFAHTSLNKPVSSISSGSRPVAPSVLVSTMDCIYDSLSDVPRARNQAA